MAIAVGAVAVVAITVVAVASRAGAERLVAVAAAVIGGATAAELMIAVTVATGADDRRRHGSIRVLRAFDLDLGAGREVGERAGARVVRELGGRVGDHCHRGAL